MTLKAAIFDVDGTIVNGNCTRIFIRYLFENNLISQVDFNRFEIKCRRLYMVDDNYYEIILDALKILSGISLADFRKHWKVCFEKRIISNLNQLIINKIKEFESQGLTVFLASGSHLELVSLVGKVLNIRKNFIIATETEIKGNHISPTPVPPVCYKEGKKEKVMIKLRSMGIEIKETLMYSDNLSDFELMTLTAGSYWTGTSELYEKYSLSKKGIARLPQLPDEERKLKGSKPTLVGKLLDYYTIHQSLIEDSIHELFPEKCTPETMDQLVGKVDLTWDYETLQKYFFDPFYHYINERKTKTLCLGSLIFMEAAGIKAERCKSLIGIGELLDISNDIFLEIKELTSTMDSGRINKAPLEMSIIGNVAVALITMSLNTIISNTSGLNHEKQLLLIEELVSVGFDSLFGNGLDLYREQLDQLQPGSEKHDRMIYLKNKRKLQIPVTLWLLFQQTEPPASTVTALNTFVEQMTLAIYYHQILYHDDKKQALFVETKNLVKQQLISVEYRNRALYALQEVPISQKYLHLISSYCDLLMNQLT